MEELAGHDASSGDGLGGFLATAYPASFISLEDKITHEDALSVSLLGLGVFVAGICAGGALADRFGPRPVAATGHLR